MMVFVCGLSRSGKSDLIKRANLYELGLHIFKGSQILRSNKRPVEQITAFEAIENQICIFDTLSTALSNQSSRIVLDGHLLIETVEGPLLVPDKKLQTLPITGIIFVKADSQLISQRRIGSGLTTSTDEISALATLESLHAQRISRQIRSTYVELPSENDEDFKEIVSNLMTQSGAPVRH